MMRRLSAVFALASLSLLAADNPTVPSDPKPEGPSVRFRSDVSLARADAQVVDRDNHPIRGLSADDFVLRIDGKQQEIHDLQTEKTPVDVLLLLDVSRSMEPHVQRIVSASRQALGVLGDDDRIAIMAFDTAARVRMPFRASRGDAQRELARLLDQERFDGGTDITRGLLDAADYVARNARREARRAIVILTDDQTQRSRNEAAVLRELTRADAVLSALIAPDALHTGTGSRDRSAMEDRLQQLFGDILPPGFAVGPRTRSAGTASIASQSGGDSMTVDDASAFQDTLARIRERYALYYYLPEGAQPGAVEIELSDAARQRYPGAEVKYRRTHAADDGGPVRVSLPAHSGPGNAGMIAGMAS